MPGTHESCNKFRLSHTSALGELLIADKREGMQAKVYEFDSCPPSFLAEHGENVHPCDIERHTNIWNIRLCQDPRGLLAGDNRKSSRLGKSDNEWVTC